MPWFIVSGIFAFSSFVSRITIKGQATPYETLQIFLSLSYFNPTYPALTLSYQLLL